MKTLILLFFLSSSPACHKDSTSVYICDSSGGKKYHLREDCRGLRNCSHRIIKISLEEARKRGKTLCGFEK